MIVPQLREACNLFSQSIVFLSETKNRTKYIEKVKTILRFEEMVVVKAMNRASRLDLLWNKDVEVLKVVTISFTVEALVRHQSSKISWWFIEVYASSEGSIRKKQWKESASRGTNGYWLETLMILSEMKRSGVTD